MFFVFNSFFLAKFKKLTELNAPEGQSQTISNFLCETNLNPEKTKKMQTLTHQLVPTWVLQVCFFLFSFVFWFFSMFFLFLTQKKSKENQKKKQKNADPNPPACTYMGLAILFVLFSRFFLVFDQKKQKTGENPRKNADPSPNSPACTYMGLAILACWV